MLRELMVNDDDLKRLQFLARNLGASPPPQSIDFFYQTDYPYNVRWLLKLIGQLICRVNYLEHIHHIETQDYVDAVGGASRGKEPQQV